MSSLKMFLIALLVLCASASADQAELREKPRVILSTDIGGSDPDDFQSMVHYLIYADRFDTEGLISSPPFGGRAADILTCIGAYEKDYAKLRTWSSSYPTPDTLRGVVRQGVIASQPGEQPDAEISDGAALIIERAQTEDSRPLYLLVWGSITDVAQAVHAAPGIKGKLRIYSIGSWNTRSDERARAYLFNTHPDLWWVESDTTFRGMYMGGTQDGEFGNRSFPESNIKGHGYLGALFMEKKPDIKMGDTPSVLYLLHGDPNTPEAEHWGGAYVRPDPDKRPTYWHDNPDSALAHKDKAGAVTVSQWRKDYLLDWKAKMDRVLTEKTVNK